MRQFPSWRTVEMWATRLRKTLKSTSKPSFPLGYTCSYVSIQLKRFLYLGRKLNLDRNQERVLCAILS